MISRPGTPHMDRTAHSIASQRQGRIVDRLRSASFLGIQDLCADLGISEATARRDLAELESQGRLRRTHGGAVPCQQVARDFTNAERLSRHPAEKQRIAQAAAALVQEGDVVFLDAGTTTLQVAQALSTRRDLTFITNGVDICNHLTAAQVDRLYVIGGQYFDATHGFAGPLAAEAIGRFTVDKVFLSVGAVDLERRTICISLPELAEAQRAMIAIAHKVYVVADHSKFERSALSVIAALDDLDCVITNAATRAIARDLSTEIARKIVFA